MLTQEIKDSLSEGEPKKIQTVVCSPNPLAKARERGRKYKEECIQAALRPQDVASLIKVSDEDLARLRQLNKIVFLQDGNDYVYPKCQFDQDKIIDGIDQVIAELPTIEGWTQLIFLESRDPSLQGDKPIDRLKLGDISAVVLAASNYGQQRPV